MNLDLTKTIDEAYTMYMPQVRYEIEEFYEFLNEHYQNKLSDEYNVLEIGTKFGGTFYLWCMMNQSSGLNISIDMNDGGLHGGIDEQKMDERDKWFKEKFNNCHFIRGDSHESETWNDLIYEFHSDHEEYAYFIDCGDRKQWNSMYEKCVDFLFIDGDHTYEGVKKDFEMYSPFVKNGGCIAFHDIKDTQKHRERQVEVAKFWNEIKNDYEYVEFSDPLVDWGGIGALVKK